MDNNKERKPLLDERDIEKFKEFFRTYVSLDIETEKIYDYGNDRTRITVKLVVDGETIYETSDSVFD